MHFITNIHLGVEKESNVKRDTKRRLFLHADPMIMGLQVNYVTGYACLPFGKGQCERTFFTSGCHKCRKCRKRSLIGIALIPFPTSFGETMIIPMGTQRSTCNTGGTRLSGECFSFLSQDVRPSCLRNKFCLACFL